VLPAAAMGREGIHFYEASGFTDESLESFSDHDDPFHGDDVDSGVESLSLEEPYREDTLHWEWEAKYHDWVRWTGLSIPRSPSSVYGAPESV